MDALFFIIYMWAAPNPYDAYAGQRLRIPPTISLAAYVEASHFETVTPEDMMGMMMQEHSSHAPYPGDSVGDKGRSVGLYQLSSTERRDYNDAFQTAYTREDLFDIRINTRVAAHVFHDDHVTHAKARRCRGKAHTPEGHHVCGPKHRDGGACLKRGELRHNLIRYLSRWREQDWRG